MSMQEVIDWLTGSDNQRLNRINGNDYDYSGFDKSKNSYLVDVANAYGLDPSVSGYWNNADEYWQKRDKDNRQGYIGDLTKFYGVDSLDDLTDDQIGAYSNVMDNYEIDITQPFIFSGLGGLANDTGHSIYNSAIGSNDSLDYLKTLMTGDNAQDAIISSLAKGDTSVADDVLATMGTGNYDNINDAYAAYQSGNGAKGNRGTEHYLSLVGSDGEFSPSIGERSNRSYNPLTVDNNATLGLDADRIGLDVASMVAPVGGAWAKAGNAAKDIGKAAKAGDQFASGLANKLNPARKGLLESSRKNARNAREAQEMADEAQQMLENPRHWYRAGNYADEAKELDRELRSKPYQLQSEIDALLDAQRKADNARTDAKFMNERLKHKLNMGIEDATEYYNRMNNDIKAANTIPTRGLKQTVNNLLAGRKYNNHLREMASEDRWKKAKDFRSEVSRPSAALRDVNDYAVKPVMNGVWEASKLANGAAAANDLYTGRDK